MGGGIIGLSLAISLRKEGLRVLVVERSEPGQEASSAAAGMLVGSGAELPAPLGPLAAESARMYPEFARELEDESGMKVDLRDQGTILISRQTHLPDSAELITAEQLRSLEPEVKDGLRDDYEGTLAYVRDRSVDPRALVQAAAKAARRRHVDISSGTEAKEVLIEKNRATGIRTDKTSYFSGIVVNCAGAWAGCIAPQKFPVRPVKGQMLAVVAGPALRHVIRADEVYLVPRTDGRIIIGSTLENDGYNKQVDVNAIQRLLNAAVEVIPELARAKKHEDWAGLRPGTPDELPILGETSTRGYFVASGHYRDGILLAPITARLMTEKILAKSSAHDLSSFSPSRFL
jgi:glycine oxidase